MASNCSFSIDNLQDKSLISWFERDFGDLSIDLREILETLDVTEEISCCMIFKRTSNVS